jgi:ribokinase
MIGQVGNDSDGIFMRDNLRNSGVHVDGTVLTVDDVATGTAVVLVQKKGDNSIVIVGGANTAKWKWEEAALEALKDADVVLLQQEVDKATNIEVVRRCAAAGVPVILDAGGAEGELDEEIGSNVATISPNATELKRIVKMPTETPEEVESAARALQSQCNGCDVLVKLGDKGCLMLSGVKWCTSLCIRANLVCLWAGHYSWGRLHHAMSFFMLPSDCQSIAILAK